MKLKVKYLTKSDAEVCSKEANMPLPYLEKVLGYKGFKVGVFKDDKLCYMFVVLYGSKPKSAYIAELWTDGGMFAKRVVIHILTLFNKIHKRWFVVFHSDKQKEYYGSRSIPYNDKLFQYIGCL